MDRNNSTFDGTGLSHPVLERERTLAIVIGASEWPSYPDFHAVPSCRRSAYDLVDYLRSRNGLNLPPRNIKALIDPSDDAPEIMRQMHRFVRERRSELSDLGTPATDLIFYYIGHGGLTDSNAFFLAIRSTDEDDPLGTSITAESLGVMIRDRAAGLRTYLILDCCFAASLSKVFMSGGPIGVASEKLRNALPPQGDALAIEAGKLPAYGTALLCASGPRDAAKAPPDLPHTMFSGELLGVLKTGDSNAPAWLSLDDIQRLVRARLEAQFLSKAVLPQIHAPQQRMGRVDLVPLFPNPASYEAARRAEERRRAQEEAEQRQRADAEHRRQEKEAEERRRHEAEERRRAQEEAEQRQRANTEHQRQEKNQRSWQEQMPAAQIKPEVDRRGKREGLRKYYTLNRRAVILTSVIAVGIFALALTLVGVFQPASRTLTGHTGVLFSVAFSPDGWTLASGSSDGTVKLWDPASGHVLHTLSNDIGPPIDSIAFSPDGRTLASGNSGNTVALWDAASGQLQLTLTGHTGYVFSVAFSPDGRTLASGSADDTVKLWDAARGKLLHTLTAGDTVFSVAFSPDGRTLASGSSGNTVALWDAASGQLVRRLTGHTGAIKSVAFSPDGRTLGSGSFDDTVKLWDPASGQLLRTLMGHTSVVDSVAFSPDGRTLASGSWDRAIKLWDPARGQLLRTLTAPYTVYSVALSPDGRTLASGGDGMTVKLWDISGITAVKTGNN